MNKQELVRIVAEKTGLTQKDIGLVIDETLNGITQTLSEGNKITFVGFGSFEVKQRQAHMGVNPSTKEKIHIEASNVPTFKAGKLLKKAVN
ncbi:MAG: HU family DNA-binding protein [Clostridia bacterium]|nr:HU family DNA-binding protein [Clostridia bacterium]